VLAFIALAALGQPGRDFAPDPPLTPNAVLLAATDDLAHRVPYVKKAYTRYLSLHAVPADRRDDLARACLFWINSTTFRRRFVPIERVGPGEVLLRLDLQALEWDCVARGRKLSQLEGLGLDFGPAAKGSKRADFVDVWESFAHKDPYFKVSQVEHGEPFHGWLDPALEYQLRFLSKSALAVLRADWWLVQASLDRPLGLYSDLLMLPVKEKDLYKRLGIDEAFIARERLATGDAVQVSIVARNNRGLELLPSPLGRGARYLWRTYDVTDSKRARSALQNFLGQMHADGRELIYSLPNGLQGYYLANAKGEQVGEVPISIAQDRLDPEEARVIAAYKCVNCHGNSGINGSAGTIKALMDATDKGVALAVISPSKSRVAELRAALDDYYTSHLGTETAAHQASYTAAVKELAGRPAPEVGKAFLGEWNAYQRGRVDLPTAAREMGYPLDRIGDVLTLSNNGELIALKGGATLARDQFEASQRDALRNQVYPWDAANGLAHPVGR
jgi:mono/diheme cytochrome c family protein